MEEAVEDRVERAWGLARQWFESKSGDLQATIHVRFGAVDLDRAADAMEDLRRRSRAASTSSVWTRPEDVDLQIAAAKDTVRRCAGALREGKLAALSLHYEIELGSLTATLLLTILRTGDREVEATGFTQMGFLRPAHLPLKQRFVALARHVVDLSKRLGTAEASFGVDREAEGSRRVRV